MYTRKKDLSASLSRARRKFIYRDCQAAQRHHWSSRRQRLQQQQRPLLAVGQLLTERSRLDSTKRWHQEAAATRAAVERPVAVELAEPRRETRSE